MNLKIIIDNKEIELCEIDKPESEANDLRYYIDICIRTYMLEHKDFKPVKIKFLTDKTHNRLFIDYSKLNDIEWQNFKKVIEHLGFEFTFSSNPKIAEIEEENEFL